MSLFSHLWCQKCSNILMAASKLQSGCTVPSDLYLIAICIYLFLVWVFKPRLRPGNATNQEKSLLSIFANQASLAYRMPVKVSENVRIPGTVMLLLPAMAPIKGCRKVRHAYAYPMPWTFQDYDHIRNNIATICKPLIEIRSILIAVGIWHMPGASSFEGEQKSRIMLLFISDLFLTTVTDFRYNRVFQSRNQTGSSNKVAAILLAECTGDILLEASKLFTLFNLAISLTSVEIN